MHKRLQAAFLVAALLVPAVSMAAMPEPKVEYSADSRMETDGFVMTSKVYHARQKERMEMKQDGSRNIMIMRRDKKVSWVLMPDQKMYLEMGLEEAQQKGKDINDCSIRQTSVGSDTVNGIRTTKSKISMTCPENMNYEGTMWATRDGIMVKMDAVAKAEDRDVHMKIELKNLKVGKQDPKLFEVPAGYQKMEVPNMGNFGAMSAGFVEEQKRQVREAREKEEARKRQESAADDESGRSYTSKPRKKANRTEEGRSYTSAGRSYTSQKRSDSGSPIDAIRGGIKSGMKSLLSW